MPGIVDYVNAKNFENYIVNALVGKLKYLLDIRNSISKDLDNVNNMIEEIIVEMKEAGVDIEYEYEDGQ